MLPRKIAFVDLETTGARASYDRIIEIGIVRIEDNAIVDTYTTLLNPEKHLPPEIINLTGITPEDLEHAPTFRNVAKDIYTLLKDCVFVAHNVRFDYSFLKHELKREEITYTAKHFCTVKLSRILYPTATHHNLDAVIARCGFTCERRHRAFDDAKVLYDFYTKIQKDFSENVVTQAVNQALKKPSLPTRLTETDLDALPESPGVYMFYGENKTPLYIGKSKNIRERVLSHFSGDLTSSKEMRISQQIETVETRITAGELGALLMESSLIKQHLPIYNRMLRIKRELIGLRILQNEKGYNVVHLEPIHDIKPSDVKTFLGFFRSRKQAKTFLADAALEYNLCEKLLSLEKSSTTCFGYRLDRCKGACINEENPLFYNLRFTTAFSKMRVTPWPFKGPIIIKEKSILDDRIDYFLIDEWCFLGSKTFQLQESFFHEATNAYLFDLDIYKIIKQYLRNPNNIKNIREISESDKKSLLLGDVDRNDHLVNY